MEIAHKKSTYIKQMSMHFFFVKKVKTWMGGWMDGLMGGCWMEVKAGLRIVYSNQKY